MNAKNTVEIKAEIPLRCFAVSAYVVRRTAGEAEFLLMRRRSHYLDGVWQPVAGRIEPGETAWQAAWREIHEEAGLCPERLYSANITESFYESNLDCISVMPVFVAFLDSEQEVRLSSEHREYRWLGAAAAKELVTFEQYRHGVDHIEAMFIQREPPAFFRMDAPPLS